MVSEEINIIKENLYEWFLDNDTLVVPDLGRFEAIYTGATIQAATHKLTPPNKTLTFNPFAKVDDGVFVEYIVQKEIINPEQARQWIGDFVRFLQEELAVRKKYKITGFGTFMATPEQGIAFSSGDEANLLGDSYGLTDFFTTPTNLYKTKPEEILDQDTYDNFEKEENKNQTVFENNSFSNPNFNPNTTKPLEDDILVEQEVKDTSSRRLLTVIFGVLFVICGLFAYFLMTDTNLFGTSSEATDEKLKNKNTYEDKLEELTDKEEDKSKLSKNEDKKDGDPFIENPQLNYETNDNYVKTFKYNPAMPANLQSISVKGEAGRYHVILGSFGKAENAYSYFNNLQSKGISNSRIITPNAKNTLYRVTCGDYATRKEARIRGDVFCKGKALKYMIIKY